MFYTNQCPEVNIPHDVTSNLIPSNNCAAVYSVKPTHPIKDLEGFPYFVLCILSLGLDPMLKLAQLAHLVTILKQSKSYPPTPPLLCSDMAVLILINVIYLIAHHGQELRKVEQTRAIHIHLCHHILIFVSRV